MALGEGTRSEMATAFGVPQIDEDGCLYDRTGWLGRQDSNLCISESEFANPLKIRTHVAAIKRALVVLRRFARARVPRELSCSAVPETSNNIRQK